MKNYDWIVIGGGLAGSALSYELARVGCSVLLLEQSHPRQGATRYSYGGIAYWSVATPMMRQLCQASQGRYPHLAEELAGETEFQELNLLLTIPPDRHPEQVMANYAATLTPPALLSVEAACALEPLLNPEAIAAALLLCHGHVNPEALVNAYQQAFLRWGGTVEIAQVTGLSAEGVSSPTATYRGKNIAVCAGGMTRSLLQQAGLPVRLYYSQAEIIETPPLDLKLQTMIMPAELKRFEMEAASVQVDERWNEPGYEVVPPILDVGVVQFRDGSLRIGQFTRAMTDLFPVVDAAQSETALRAGVGELLPTLRQVPGQWRNCLVAFSGDRLPLIGAMPQAPHIHLFSGFSNPFAILPPLAQRFAQQVVGQPDELLAQLLPGRFDSESQ